MSARNLVLIGFMGVGKSTVGRQCAANLQFDFEDTDRVIEAKMGCSVAEVFAEQGEGAFRSLERTVIADLASEAGQVIATGGGAPLDPVNAANLRAGGLVVLLTATPTTILRRVGNLGTRPLLAGAADPRAVIIELLGARMPLYRKAAHLSIDTTHRTVKQLSDEIADLFRRESAR